MIIDVDYIRQFRQLAHNIADASVERYIREAEHLDVLPAIGAELYRRYTETPDEELTAEERTMLDGGYWDGGDGVTRKFDGLKTALAYLAYARFIRNHSTNVTVYGVVVKTGEDSTPADVRAISAASLDAQRIGEAYLGEAVRYWEYIKRCACQAHSTARKRFTAIGN